VAPTGIAAVIDALRARAAAAGVPFVDDQSPAPWVTGSGSGGVFNGSGNAWWVNAADGAHYTDAGHAYRAGRIGDRLEALGLA
jgi:hypothetical protein